MASPINDLSDWDALNALAIQHSEGWRTFHQDKYAEAAYEIAPLPDGRCAIQIKCAYKCGDWYSSQIPWRAYSSREEALQAFLDRAKNHFGIVARGKEQEKAQRRMLELLRGVFKEPEAKEDEPVSEERPSRPPMAARVKRESGATQGMLF